MGDVPKRTMSKLCRREKGAFLFLHGGQPGMRVIRGRY